LLFLSPSLKGGKTYFIKVNDAPIEVDVGIGYLILHHDGTTSRSWTWKDRGDLIMFVWDGVYWTNSPMSK
jgi:hypothetical protein